jgi:V8-like Glu-specific endopeptidase
MNARVGGAQRALAAALGGALLIFIAVAALGESRAAAKGHWVEPQSAREAGDFWTLARMRAARPLELTSPGGGKGAPREPRGKGRPRRIAAKAARVSNFGDDFVLVPDSTTPEFRVHGAIFISLGIFGYGRCSGTAVRSPNQSVVFTAAHCVHSGGRRGEWFPDGAVFVPGYRYGQRPFGVFPVRWIDTAKGWRSSGSRNFDVGAMVVGRNQRGQLLTEAVGGAGIAWNLEANQTFDVHGYPAGEPFDGETQRLCDGVGFLGHDAGSFVSPGPLNLAVDCGVTGGASGGGWTIEGGELNSVTNYTYFDEASPVYGSYFGKEAARLYGRAVKVR